jgi:hypothetical protein
MKILHDNQLLIQFMILYSKSVTNLIDSFLLMISIMFMYVE